MPGLNLSVVYTAFAGLAIAAAGCGGGQSTSAARAPAAPTAPSPGGGHPQRATSSSSRRSFLLGRSVDGRSITAVRVGRPDAPRRLLVVGCIHGNERAGILIARGLIHVRPPRGTVIWVIPVLNPDGAAANTRQNAHLVDLNRNFPWHWRAIGGRGDLQYSGTAPLSEPESRAADAVIRRVRPQITIWFHQPLRVVDLSGGDPAIEHEFAQLVGLPTERLTRYPGSAVSWTNSVVHGGTSFVVELPPGSLSAPDTGRYVRAILTLAGR